MPVFVFCHGTLTSYKDCPVFSLRVDFFARILGFVLFSVFFFSNSIDLSPLFFPFLKYMQSSYSVEYCFQFGLYLLFFELFSKLFF